MRNRDYINTNLEKLDNILTNLERIVNTQEPIETYRVNIGNAKAIVSHLIDAVEREPFSPSEQNRAIR